MFTKYSNGLKGITLALAIAATSLSSAQAFGSSIESPEYGNSAWTGGTMRLQFRPQQH